MMATKTCQGARGVSIVCSVLMLAACSTDMSDLNNYMEEVKARPAQPISPIPPVKRYSPYVYEGYLVRDPFSTSTSEGVDEFNASSNSTGPSPDKDRPREYLERFELDTLSMVGTLKMEESHWALIRDPDGVVHRVSVNNYVGKNHGRITAIEELRLSLSELIPDGMGGWLAREASIVLENS